MRAVSLALATFLLGLPAAEAQLTTTFPSLPSAPAPTINFSAQVASAVPTTSGSQAILTRKQAEQTALKNNPRVSVSQLLAFAQHQVVREARSAELPTANGAIT